MPESMAVPLGGPYVDPQQLRNQSEFRRGLQYGDGYLLALAGDLSREGGRSIWGQHLTGRSCTGLSCPGDQDPASEGLWSGKTGGIFIRRRQTSLYLPAENRKGATEMSVIKAARSRTMTP